MKNNKIISSFKYWAITRKWLWQRVVFDNGVVGRNYHRYDHILYSYCQGMGDNGEYGGINTVIKLQVESSMRNCA